MKFKLKKTPFFTQSSNKTEKQQQPRTKKQNTHQKFLNKNQKFGEIINTHIKNQRTH